MKLPLMWPDSKLLDRRDRTLLESQEQKKRRCDTPTEITLREALRFDDGSEAIKKLCFRKLLLSAVRAGEQVGEKRSGHRMGDARVKPPFLL